MAVNHRKISRRKGDDALAGLKGDIRKTLDVIKEEEEYAADTAPVPASRSELAERFPAVKGGA
ncbi:hypothetical protein [Phytohabitans aurantiacus]|uniref:Uncharacterized protein n=1 Tax=Phytohabitans aurantiacus TaxID=3016789 RepID=A0ABQ5R532_9ACTN|nr:hypothetical protein [Phytohabitans aurantiacus]GLI00681.1 hypothetical protein Pa4123_59570 [Phytohabitans aurantiacus]